MDFSNFWWQAAAPAPPTGIGNSLRFRGAQTLSRTQATPTTANVVTISCWVKFGNQVGIQALFDGDNNNANNKYCMLYHLGNTGVLGVSKRIGGVDYSEDSTSVYRDPSAWYHVLYRDNGAANTELYVNGKQVQFGTGTNVATNYLNFDGALQTIGATHNSGGALTYYLDGYMTDFHAIDGQVLDPTEFGQYDNNGVWVPKAYTGTYGANGCHLDFSDPADIGADRSGNGNDFTATGFELADQTSPFWDHMEDLPTQNFATLNPLETSWFASGGITAGSNANANLTSNTEPSNHTRLTYYPQSGQKLYLEYYCATIPGSGNNDGPYYVGFVPQDFPVGTLYIGSAASRGLGFYKGGQIWFNGASVGSCLPYSISDVVQLAYNTDTGNVWQGVNGTWYNNGDPATGANPTYTMSNSRLWQFAFQEYGNSGTAGINPGQKPLRYSVPAGYTTLNTEDQPAAPIPNGRDHFQAITDTGANILTAAQTAFPNGFWWIKDRVNANVHQLMDSVRGGETASMSCPGDTSEAAYVAPAGDSVAWCWKTNGPATTNNDGTIESQVSADPDAGFSIVTWTGNYVQGSVDDLANVGHGLTKTPEFIIYKSRNATSGSPRYWYCHFKDINGNWVRNYLGFVSTAAATPAYVNANNTATTISNWSYETGQNLVAYCWHSVPGYSQIGTYQGNTSADGPFIYTGFRPAFVLVKGYNGDSSWIILDSTRAPNNPAHNVLIPNQNLSEWPDTRYGQIDIVSNGFKCRSTGANDLMNCNNTWRYVYMAFAENPFGGSNVSPSNAR